MDSTQTTPMFDAYYFAHGCGRPYQRDAAWLQMFRQIADHIRDEIQPASVLDAGCALGLLVEALRGRQIEAYGIDVADYAIAHVHPDIRAYCRVASILDPFPHTYDLIVTIEVLEHLERADSERAVANLCAHTDDILFSSSPLDYKEATHYNVQPPEYWVEQFARHDFYRDVDYDASYITPWAVRFRRRRDALQRVITAYERRHWQLAREVQARRELNLEQRDELAASALQIEALTAQVAQQERLHADIATLRTEVAGLRVQNMELEARWAGMQASLGGRILARLQNLRATLFPPQSGRDRALNGFLHRFIFRTPQIAPVPPPPVTLAAIAPRAPLQAHTATVGIVVCVHNALDDVTACLESVLAHTTLPYTLTLVDDGSDAPTRDFLAAFAAGHGATLLRNDAATGYGRAANQGMHAAPGDFVLLLNSDTVVTPGWLDRLLACAESDPAIGLAGPLSNTASWQSIPLLEENGDWAHNPLPAGVSAAEQARRVALYSDRLYPPVPFVNGFCYLIRRQVIDQITGFDEANFGQGYGEEDDFTLRARAAGWQAALADDAYVYHAQSRSYSHARRRQLSEQGQQHLADKHGQATINAGVLQLRGDKTLAGIRARAAVMDARERCLADGQARFAGRRVLFLLPVSAAGGGANVVLDEALAMQRMGVEVGIFNRHDMRPGFEVAYAGLELPVFYGEQSDVGRIARGYDAVIATHHRSVNWLAEAADSPTALFGYYIQDFEPYFYPSDSPDYAAALRSYTWRPEMMRFTKTEWNRQEVLRHTEVDCVVVGPSLNLDLFRPRPPCDPVWPERPIRIAAMVRPSSPRRAPQMTMQLLHQAAQAYGDRIQIVLFGAAEHELELPGVAQDFDYTSAGLLSQKQVARLFNEVDIFADFSVYQAMGMTALEAMACGAAVIAPERGGGNSFARHLVNAIIADTQSYDACWNALHRLIGDHDLRRRLQEQALGDVCQYYVERPAYNILAAFFG